MFLAYNSAPRYLVMSVGGGRDTEGTRYGGVTMVMMDFSTLHHVDLRHLVDLRRLSTLHHADLSTAHDDAMN